MEIAVILLFLIVAALLVERYFYTKEMNKRLTQAMELAASKHMNEYIAAKETTELPKSKETPSDEVDMEEATDKEFMQHIEKQTQ